MTATTAATPLIDDRLARRNALLLAAAQAIGGAMMSITIATGGLTGFYLLGPDKSLATLPVTTMVLGTACGTVPAALLMRRLGRRGGFLTGAGIGAIGIARLRPETPCVGRRAKEGIERALRLFAQLDCISHQPGHRLGKPRALARRQRIIAVDVRVRDPRAHLPVDKA